MSVVVVVVEVVLVLVGEFKVEILYVVVVSVLLLAKTIVEFMAILTFSKSSAGENKTGGFNKSCIE